MTWPIRSINSDDSVFSDTMSIENLCDPARFFHRQHELGSLFRPPHRTVADGPWPDRCHERSHSQPMTGDLVGNFLHIVFAQVNIDVRIKQKEINSIKMLTVDGRAFCQIEHAIEGNKGFSIR